MNKREDISYLNDWDSLRLLRYYQDLQKEKGGINRHTKRRVAKILEEPKRKIDIVMHQSFLGEVQEDDESYTLGFIVLEGFLKHLGYFKEENKGGLRMNNTDIIYKKGVNIITINLQTGEIKTGVLVEKIGGLMSDERRQEMKNKYGAELGLKYIFFTQIGDLYDNYILEYTGYYHTQRLQNQVMVKKLLLEISSL